MSIATSKNIKTDPGCIASALNIIGDKWTALLIRELVVGHRCYSELQATLTGISPRTLSARLEKLVTAGIITKQLYCQHPPRYNYVLSYKGQELEKILRAMANWGEKFN